MLIAIDFQSQTSLIDVVALRNDTALVSRAGAGFGVSIILTAVAEKTFSGPMFDEVADVFLGHAVIDRTSMNTWEDKDAIAKVNEIGNARIVLAGLWSSVCTVGPSLSAIDQSFEVYGFADARGDVSAEVELGVSSLVFLDRGMRLGAGALGVFTRFSTLLAHRFWELAGEVRAADLNNFLVHPTNCAAFILVVALDLRKPVRRA